MKKTELQTFWRFLATGFVGLSLMACGAASRFTNLPEATQDANPTQSIGIYLTQNQGGQAGTQALYRAQTSSQPNQFLFNDVITLDPVLNSGAQFLVVEESVFPIKNLFHLDVRVSLEREGWAGEDDSLLAPEVLQLGKVAMTRQVDANAQVRWVLDLKTLLGGNLWNAGAGLVWEFYFEPSFFSLRAEFRSGVPALPTKSRYFVSAGATPQALSPPLAQGHYSILEDEILNPTLRSFELRLRTQWEQMRAVTGVAHQSIYYNPPAQPFLQWKNNYKRVASLSAGFVGIHIQTPTQDLSLGVRTLNPVEWSSVVIPPGGSVKLQWRVAPDQGAQPCGLPPRVTHPRGGVGSYESIDWIYENFVLKGGFDREVEALERLSAQPRLPQDLGRQVLGVSALPRVLSDQTWDQWSHAGYAGSSADPELEVRSKDPQCPYGLP